MMWSYVRYTLDSLVRIMVVTKLLLQILSYLLNPLQLFCERKDPLFLGKESLSGLNYKLGALHVGLVRWNSIALTVKFSGGFKVTLVVDGLFIQLSLLKVGNGGIKASPKVGQAPSQPHPNPSDASKTKQGSIFGRLLGFCRSLMPSLSICVTNYLFELESGDGSVELTGKSIEVSVNSSFTVLSVDAEDLSTAVVDKSNQPAEDARDAANDAGMATKRGEYLLCISKLQVLRQQHGEPSAAALTTAATIINIEVGEVSLNIDMNSNSTVLAVLAAICRSTAKGVSARDLAQDFEKRFQNLSDQFADDDAQNGDDDKLKPTTDHHQQQEGKEEEEELEKVPSQTGSASTSDTAVSMEQMRSDSVRPHASSSAIQLTASLDTLYIFTITRLPQRHEEDISSASTAGTGTMATKRNRLLQLSGVAVDVEVNSGAETHGDDGNKNDDVDEADVDLVSAAAAVVSRASVSVSVKSILGGVEVFPPRRSSSSAVADDGIIAEGADAAAAGGGGGGGRSAVNAIRDEEREGEEEAAGSHLIELKYRHSDTSSSLPSAGVARTTNMRRAALSASIQPLDFAVSLLEWLPVIRLASDVSTLMKATSATHTLQQQKQEQQTKYPMRQAADSSPGGDDTHRRAQQAGGSTTTVDTTAADLPETSVDVTRTSITTTVWDQFIVTCAPLNITIASPFVPARDDSSAGSSHQVDGDYCSSEGVSYVYNSDGPSSCIVLSIGEVAVSVTGSVPASADEDDPPADIGEGGDEGGGGRRRNLVVPAAEEISQVLNLSITSVTVRSVVDDRTPPFDLLTVDTVSVRSLLITPSHSDSSAAPTATRILPPSYCAMNVDFWRQWLESSHRSNDSSSSGRDQADVLCEVDAMHLKLDPHSIRALGSLVGALQAGLNPTETPKNDRKPSSLRRQSQTQSVLAMQVVPKILSAAARRTVVRVNSVELTVECPHVELLPVCHLAAAAPVISGNPSSSRSLVNTPSEPRKASSNADTFVIKIAHRHQPNHDPSSSSSSSSSSSHHRRRSNSRSRSRSTSSLQGYTRSHDNNEGQEEEVFIRPSSAGLLVTTTSVPGLVSATDISLDGNLTVDFLEYTGQIVSLVEAKIITQGHSPPPCTTAEKSAGTMTGNQPGRPSSLLPSSPTPSSVCFSVTRFPADLHALRIIDGNKQQHHQQQQLLGMATFTSVSSVCLESVSVHLDAYDLRNMVSAIATFGGARRYASAIVNREMIVAVTSSAADADADAPGVAAAAEEAVAGSLSAEEKQMKINVNPLKSTVKNNPLRSHHVSKHPQSIFSTRLGFVSLVLSHERVPVFSTTARKTEVYSTSFGDGLTQVSGSLTSIVVCELTYKEALHKILVREIDSTHPSMLQFHFTTTKIGEYPILEIEASGQRIMYLQRSTMTLVSFFRDHFLAAVNRERAAAGAAGDVSTAALAAIEESLLRAFTSTSADSSSTSASSTGSINGGRVTSPAAATAAEDAAEANNHHEETWRDSQQPPTGPRGMFRLGVKLSASEIHLPISSSGTDSLCLVFSDCEVYKSFPASDAGTIVEETISHIHTTATAAGGGGSSAASGSGSHGSGSGPHSGMKEASQGAGRPGWDAACSYAKGPLLTSGTRLSELKNVRKVLRPFPTDLFASLNGKEKTTASMHRRLVQRVSELEPSWKLPTYARDADQSGLGSGYSSTSSSSHGAIHRTGTTSTSTGTAIIEETCRPSNPFLIPDSIVSVASSFFLVVKIPSGTISSWCSQNSIADGIDLTVTLNITPVLPTSDAMYASVMKSQGFDLKPTSKYRNTILVDVDIANKVEMSLSQGQYSLIAYAILQNFSEAPHWVPDIFRAPKPKHVHLRESIYGSNAMQSRLPIMSTVPAHIPSGRIALFENTPDYYEFYSRLLRLQQQQSSRHSAVPHAAAEGGEAVGGASRIDTTACVNSSTEIRTTEAVHLGLYLNTGVDTADHILSDSIPSWGYHHTHRVRLLGQHAATLGEAGSGSRSSTQQNTAHSAAAAGAAAVGVAVEAGDDIDIEEFWDKFQCVRNLPSYRRRLPAIRLLHRRPEIGTPVAVIHFTKLEMDFYRKHYGGGNGMEISAGTMIIVGAHSGLPRAGAAAGAAGDNYDHNDTGDGIGESDSVMSEDADEISAEYVILAPKSLPQMNKSYTTAASSSSSNKSGRRPSRGANSTEAANTVPVCAAANAARKNGSSTASGGVPAGGISPATAAAATVSPPHIVYRQQGVGNLRRCVVELLDSIIVTNAVGVAAVANFFIEPIRMNTMRSHNIVAQRHGERMDFKASLDLEVYARNSVLCLPRFPEDEERKRLKTAQASVVCFYCDLTFTQALRGFLQSGPGKSTRNIVVAATGMCISPIHEIQSSCAQSLVAPFVASLTVELMILPPEPLFAKHLEQLAPWLELSSWILKAQGNPQNSAMRTMSVKIEPMQLQDAALKSFGDEYVSEWARWESHRKNSEDSDNDSERDVPVSGSEIQMAQSRRVLNFFMSLKDVAFIIEAVNQVSRSLAGRPSRPSIQDRFAPQFSCYQDIDNVPLLTKFIPAHVPALPQWTIRSTDILIEVSDIEIVLRNNTYNFKIAKMEVSEIRSSFNSSVESLHTAAGLRCSVWTYNDAADMWEPILEPFAITAIGATDTTGGDSSQTPLIEQQSISEAGESEGDRDGPAAASASASTAAAHGNNKPDLVQRIRVEAFCEPLDFNVPQRTLISLTRKLGLADVVTTSSADLPPYSVINELGVPVRCLILSDGETVSAEDIGVGEQLPMEIQHVVSNTAKRRLAQTQMILQQTPRSKLSTRLRQTQEHLLSIQFSVDGTAFDTRDPIPVDHEGSYPFDMQRRVSGKPATSSASATSSTVNILLPHVAVTETPASASVEVLAKQEPKPTNIKRVIPDKAPSTIVSSFSGKEASREDVGHTASVTMATFSGKGEEATNDDMLDTPSKAILASMVDAAHASWRSTANSIAAMPTISLPDMPTLPELPTMSLPDLPDIANMSLPDMPTMEFPDMPTMEFPDMPTMEFPDLPSMSMPALPSMPGLPTLSDIPDMPSMPELPSFSGLSTSMTSLPEMPSIPSLPDMPTLADLPAMPTMPDMPAMPSMSDVWRFSSKQTRSRGSSITAAGGGDNHGSSHGKEDNSEKPFALVTMRVKADGGRELLLRSMLSLKNNTGRVFQLSVRNGVDVAEFSLSPGAEWNVPVHLALPKASLFLRLDGRSEWFNALSSFGSLIISGKWGAPKKLRAEMCNCPSESQSWDTNTNTNTNTPENSWILLLKPEVPSARDGSRSYVSVKYPTRESRNPASSDPDSNDPAIKFDQLYRSFQSSFMASAGTLAQPMCLQLIAPLQLCSILSQPLLYRISDTEGWIIGEGALLPGEILDLHHLRELFSSKIYISIRLLNYSWSKWTKIFTRSSPYPSSEKILEVVLSSLELTHHAADLTLPSLSITLAMREHFIRISCPILVSNHTGLQLDVCESSAPEFFVPLSSRPAVDMLIASGKKEGVVASSTSTSSLTVKLGRNNGLSDSVIQRSSLSDDDGSGVSEEEDEEEEGIGQGFEEVSDEEHEASHRSSSVNRSSNTSGRATHKKPSVGAGKGRRSRSVSPSSTTATSTAAATAAPPAIVSLVIHMPFDHLREITLPVSSDWTLAEVFSRISAKLSSNSAHQQVARYVFFHWEEGKNGPKQVPHSPLVEYDLFGRHPHNNNVKSAGSASKGSDADAYGDDDEDDRDDLEESSKSSRKATSSVPAGGGNAPEKRSSPSSQKQSSPSSSSSAAIKKLPPKAPKRSSLFSAFYQSSSSTSSSPTNVPAAPLSSSPSAGIASPGGARVTSLLSSPTSNSRKESASLLPPHMEFNMLASCAKAAIPMDTKVSALDAKRLLRLRLCHVSEWNIYLQATSISVELASKDNSASAALMSMFSRPKYTYKTAFRHVEGDMPFNPPRLLGLAPALSFRTSDQNDWSNALDLLSTDFGSSGIHLSVGGKRQQSNHKASDKAVATAGATAGTGASTASSFEPLHEFGAYVERGKGFLQNVTTLSLVPRYLLISKLSDPVQVQQIGANDASSQTQVFTLMPGAVRNFHFPVRSKKKHLQLRRYAGTGAGDRSKSSSGGREEGVGQWCGEIDISSLGIVYAKLRDPLSIVKIQVEIVGASLMATLSEQSTRWPPYRFDNLTSLEVRFRQSVDTSAITLARAAEAVTGGTSSSSSSSTDQSPASAATAGGGLSTAETAAATVAAAVEADDSFAAAAVALIAEPRNPGIGKLPWDKLQPRTSCPFAWDFPQSSERCIRIELSQGSLGWEGLDVNVDELSKEKTLTLRRPLPNLTNPTAEGQLLRKDPYSGFEGPWKHVYCVLKASVMYVFSNEMKRELIEIINLSWPHEEGIELATASRYSEETTWDFISSVGITFSIMPEGGNTDAPKAAPLDVNHTRVLLLCMASHLGLFEAEDSPMKNKDGVPVGPGDGSSRYKLRDLLHSGRSIDSLLHSVESYALTVTDIVTAIQAIVEADSEESALALVNRLVAAGVLVPPSTIVDQAHDSDVDNEVEDEEDDQYYTGGAEMNDAEEGAARFFLPATTERGEEEEEREGEGEEGGTKNKKDRQESGTMVRNESDAETVMTTLIEGFYSLKDDITTKISPFKACTTTRTSTPCRTPRRSILAAGGGGSGAGDNKAKNKNGLLSVYDTLCIRVPSLATGTDTDTGIANNGDHSSAAQKPFAGSKHDGSDDGTGFSISSADSSNHYFKSIPGIKECGMAVPWLELCRGSIEAAWVASETGVQQEEAQQAQLTLESIKVKVVLRTRADGPTKVLELFEDVERRGDTWGASSATGINKDHSDVSLAGIDIMTKGYTTAQGAEVDDEEHHRLPEANDWRSKEKDSLSTVTDYGGGQGILKVEHLVSFSVRMEYIALSIIDAEPAEIAYVSLQDIELSVERTRLKISVAVTVQNMQVSNQLLKPVFTVMLFPRASKSGANRLLLPGLHQRGDKYPALHFFIQQKYHKSSSSSSAAASKGSANSGGGGGGGNNSHNIAKDTVDANLRYFDIASLWLAPMELDIDEEAFIRIMRYVQDVRSSWQSPGTSTAALIEEVLAHQHAGMKSWGIMDPHRVSKSLVSLLSSGKQPYLDYNPRNARPSRAIYFSLLQLHPLDVMMTFRPSPHFQVSNSELAIVTLVAQLDSARLCLNALIAEHAFGTTTVITDILVKHYRASLWKQFHRLIGNTDVVEGSVGLVANLGTGVYDMFYEPIDGLLDENSSFLSGLSKGGRSLASKTIGGTSAFTSKITGGIGRGVSLLTMDSNFYRTRASRRLNKATNVSEGLYVGTKELGKNIMEGVSGVVVSPYRGWESGGGVGLGLGVAKGLLGVALKPAVGVFDLASRATEGIRNSAFGPVDADLLEDRSSVSRSRIPRAFGRGGVLLPYNTETAAAQYLCDTVTGFKRDTRVLVAYHLHIDREVVEVDEKLRGECHHDLTNDFPLFPEQKSLNEAWGMRSTDSFVVMVSYDRVLLAHVRSRRDAKSLDVTAIWCCPAGCIEQLFSDHRGDLVLSVGSRITVPGLNDKSYSWSTAALPVAIDFDTQDYRVFQTMLEQTVGMGRARLHPLLPSGGLIHKDVAKRYSSGLKSILLTPTKHTIQLFGNLLYEYTAAPKKFGSAEDGGGGSSGSVTHGDPQAAATAIDFHQNNSSSSSSIQSMKDDKIARKVCRIFGKGVAAAGKPKSGASDSTSPRIGADMAAAAAVTDEGAAGDRPTGVLTYIYPLVDVVVIGPYLEEVSSGKHSISISRKDGQSMRVLKRDEETGRIIEHHKSMLTLIFNDVDSANLWRAQTELHVLSVTPKDVVAPTIGQVDRLQAMSMAALKSIGVSGADDEYEEDVREGSILRSLVIPTSGMLPRETESLKIEIARMLSSRNWR